MVSAIQTIENVSLSFYMLVTLTAECSFSYDLIQVGINFLTSLNVAIACTTSLVNVLPAPEDPIKTVGLIDWHKKRIVRVSE